MNAFILIERKKRSREAEHLLFLFDCDNIYKNISAVYVELRG